MEEVDFYYGLDAFEQQEEKKSKELEDLENKYQKSLKTVKQLEDENKALKKKIQKIEINFQNLLDTARSEIQRKNREIDRLRTEKDDLCFRRISKHQSDSGKSKSDGQIAVKKIEISLNDNTDFVESKKKVSPQKKGKTYQNKDGKRIRSRSRSYSREQSKSSHKRHRSRSRSVEKYNRRRRRSHSFDSIKYNRKGSNQMKCHNKALKSKETSYVHADNNSKDHKGKSGQNKSEHSKNYNYRSEIHESSIKQTERIKKQHDPKQNLKTKKEEKRSELNDFQSFEPDRELVESPSFNSISCEDISGERIFKENCDNQSGKSLTTSSAISSGDHIDVNEQTTYLKIAGFDKNFSKILDASTTSRELSFDTGFVNFKRNTANFKGEKEEEIIEIPGLDLIATNAVISNQSVEENIFAKIADSDSKVSSPTVCHKSGNLLQGLEYSTEHKMPEDVRKIDLRDENVKIGNLKDSHLKNLLGKELTNASSENLLRQNEIRASKGNDQDENEINLKRENSTFLELYNDKSSQILKISRKTAEKAFSGRKTCDKEIPLTSAITKIQNINSKQKENGLIMNEVEQSKRPEQEQLLSKNLEKHNESVTSHKSEEDVNRQKSSFEAKSSKLSTKEKVSLDEDGKTYDNGSSNAKICEIGETILKKVSESCGHMSNNGNSRTSTNVQQEKVLADQEVSSDVISLQNPNHMAESWQSGQVEPLKENSQTLIEAERIISGQGKKSENIINQTIFSETICLPASVENDTKSSQEKCGSAALGTIMTSFCTNNLFVGAKEKNSSLCQASNSAQICLLPPKNENKSQLISAANIVNDEKGKLKLSVSKEKGENLVGETATPNSDQQIENNCELVERKAGQEKLRLCSLEKKEKGNICSFTNTDVNNKSVKVCSLSGDHKQNMKSVPKAPEEQNRNKNELHITDENLGGADKDFSITLQPILSQESANIPYAMSSDKVLYSKKEEIILRKETKKLEIPVKEVEEFGNSLRSNDLSSQLENLNKTQMAFNAMQIRKETDIDINSADDDKGRIRLITKEIDEENVNKVAQVIKLLPELNVVPKALNNGNNEAVFPKSLHICNSNATITSKSTQLNIVVASLLKSPYCNISNNPQPAKETSPTKPSSEASSRSVTASTNSTDVSNKLNKFITDNAHETSVTNALKNSCVVHQLPCITNHSMETSVNFNNVFSKTNQETLATTTLTSNSLDLVRSINHKSSIKHKEYILPAASVLCNVHNLENATKLTEMTNKSAFSTIATSKQKITEIEDGSDSDRTNKESAERKEISEPFIKSPKKASLTCLENLSNSDLSNGNNDDDNSSIKDLKNDKEIVLKKPPLLGLAPITKAVCYYKQVKRLGKKKFYFRNVQARRTKKFRSVKSKFKPRDGWGIKRRNRNSLPLYAIDVKGAESQESKVFDKYEKNSITSKCLNSSETEKKDQKQACVENLRAEKEMEEKKGIEDETNAARRSSCENEAERLAMNATNSAQESLEISPDSPTIIQSTKAPALNVSQIKNIFLENGDKEEILPGVSKLEEICADEKANNNTFPDKINKNQTPTAYFAGLDCSKFSDVKCLEKILTANCLKNKSYKIPKLKKSFESLKSVKTNKRKLFSLQDVGIYVGPRKGHLSTFCAPKIKANETIKNHKCGEMTDQEIKKNVENNPREFKATETKKLETDVSKSNVTLAGSEVVRSGLGSDKQTRALKNKETFDETSLDYAFMKASQSGEDRHTQLKDEKTEQISNLNLIENVENTHFVEPSDRDSEQIRINSKEIFSSSSSKKGAEITKASLNHKPWDILMPRSPEIAQKSIVKPLKLLRQPVKNNTPLNERVKVDQSISKLESTFCIEGKQTQKDTDVGRKPKEKIPQESTNCGKSSIDKQKESVAVTPRFSEEKTPEQLNTSSKMFTSSEDISEQRNKINDKIDDMSDNYSQISVGVARHKRRKCVISKRRILDSDSDDEEGYSSKSEGSVSEHCNSSSLTTKFQQKSCPTLKVTQVNKNETNLDRESIQMPNGSFNLPQLNHSIFNGDSVDSTATEVVPIVNSANTSQDEKFKEIDTQLSAIFQSPQYEKDYTINNKTDVNDFKIDNKMEINTSEVIQKESGIKNQENDWASLNVSAAETTQSSLNSSANSVKCLSLGSTEYRFEKVSNNVVNLFISRKRKRKKPTVTDVLTA